MDKKVLKLGGKYKMGKKLGAGAFGEVFLGTYYFSNLILHFQVFSSLRDSKTISWNCSNKQKCLWTLLVDLNR